jgi:hypothetical protein
MEATPVAITSLGDAPTATTPISFNGLGPSLVPTNMSPAVQCTALVLPGGPVEQPTQQINESIDDITMETGDDLEEVVDDENGTSHASTSKQQCDGVRDAGGATNADEEDDDEQERVGASSVSFCLKIPINLILILLIARAGPVPLVSNTRESQAHNSAPFPRA